MHVKPLAVALVLALSGCATQTAPPPDWLAEIKALGCSATVNATCLSEVIDDHLAVSAGQSSFAMSAALHYVAASESHGKTWSLPQTLQAGKTELFTAFAAVINQAAIGNGADALIASRLLDDHEARILATFLIAVFSIRQGQHETTSEALAVLHADGSGFYREAMNQYLEAVIVTGDLEKAYAMRLHLLETLDAKDPNLAPDINDLALVYARTGLIADLTDWISKVLRSIPDLAQGDEAILRLMMVQAAVGNPPAVDTLSSLKRQEVRLAGYLEMARLYRLLGNTVLERRAIQDAVLFSQTSTLAVDRAIVVEYLSMMWFESDAL